MLTIFNQYLNEITLTDKSFNDLTNNSIEDIVKHLLTIVVDSNELLKEAYEKSGNSEIYNKQDAFIYNIYIYTNDEFVQIEINGVQTTIKKRLNEDLYNKLFELHKILRPFCYGPLYSSIATGWMDNFDMFNETEKPKVMEYLMKYQDEYNIPDEWIEDNKHYIRSGKGGLWGMKTNEVKSTSGKISLKIGNDWIEFEDQHDIVLWFIKHLVEYKQELKWYKNWNKEMEVYAETPNALAGKSLTKLKLVRRDNCINIKLPGNTTEYVYDWDKDWMFFNSAFNIMEQLARKDGNRWITYFNLSDDSFKPDFYEYLIEYKDKYEIPDEWIEDNKHYLRSKKGGLWGMRTESSTYGNLFPPDLERREKIKNAIDKLDILKEIESDEFLEFIAHYWDTIKDNFNLRHTLPSKKEWWIEHKDESPWNLVLLLIGFTNTNPYITYFLNMVGATTFFVEFDNVGYHMLYKYLDDKIKGTLLPEITDILDNNISLYKKFQKFIDKKMPSLNYLSRADKSGLLGMKTEAIYYTDEVKTSTGKKRRITPLAADKLAKMDFKLGEYVEYTDDRTNIKLLGKIIGINPDKLPNYKLFLLDAPFPIAEERWASKRQLSKIDFDQFKEELINTITNNPELLKNKEILRYFGDLIPSYLKRSDRSGLLSLKESLSLKGCPRVVFAGEYKEGVDFDNIESSIEARINMLAQKSHSIHSFEFYELEKEYPDLVPFLHILNWHKKNKQAILAFGNTPEMHYKLDALREVGNAYVQKYLQECKDYILQQIEENPTIYTKFKSTFKLLKIDPPNWVERGDRSGLLSLKETTMNNDTLIYDIKVNIKDLTDDGTYGYNIDYQEYDAESLNPFFNEFNLLYFWQNASMCAANFIAITDYRKYIPEPTIKKEYIRIMNQMAEEAKQSILNKIEEEPSLYPKYKEGIDNYVNVPQHLKRGSNSGIWGMRVIEKFEDYKLYK